MRVWVGGRDIKTDWYDHIVTAKRQPGSTFKPFVYTVAIDNGYSPDQRYIRVATGFDYSDAAPITGLSFGALDESMVVSLRVEQ